MSDIKKENAIRLENIYLEKENSPFNLENINLIIKSGQTYGFLGADNNGKTTLASIIGGFIRPDSGKIYYFDEEVNKLALDVYRSQKVGHLFKSGILFNDYTVRTNLEIVCNLSRTAKSFQRLKNILQEVDFDLKFFNVKVGKLDILQRQKVSLARVLVKEVKLIVANEPTENLNDEQTQEFLDILLRVCKNREITLIITTNSNYVCKDLDHVYGFNKGKVNFLK